LPHRVQQPRRRPGQHRGRLPQSGRGNEGALELKGRYEPTSYRLDFATRAEDFQGVMTFSGKLTGRRIGDCTK
jgi:hypothetical protein